MRGDGLRHAVAPPLWSHRARQVRRSHVKKVVHIAGKSAAGPDGIPYSAWKGLGPLRIDILHGFIKTLGSEGGVNLMLEDFPEDEHGSTAFVFARVIFSPKSLPQEHRGGIYHKPPDVRPLFVVNVDSCLMANTVRIRSEPLLARAASDS